MDRLEMLSDMAALAVTQDSLESIMRHMMACFHYRIKIIAIGSHPYTDSIVPCFGASYSQRDTTPDIPTTRIIAQHFWDDGEMGSLVAQCICESWKTIKAGCIWLDASYSSRPTVDSTDAMSMKRLHYTVEFMCMLRMRQATEYKERTVTLLAIGREAVFVASSVKQRLLYLVL
jgi:hypothetical protein